MPTLILIAVLLLLSPVCLSAQETLRAGTIFSATQAPLWAAKEGRFFEKYGIKNLEVIQFSGGQPVTRALIGGDIQISTTGGAAVVNARLKGADTVIIARTVSVFPYTMYVAKDIRNPAELKGKKLAVSTVGGSGYVAIQYALRKLGLDPDKDVAMLQVGDFSTRLASLASGTIQGTLLLPPFTLRAQELGLRPLYDLVDSGIQYPINQITTRQSFIKSQRETVKNFLKGLIAGLARFRTDREFGVKVLLVRDPHDLRRIEPRNARVELPAPVEKIRHVVREEIGNRLEISPGTVGTLLTRAYRKIVNPEGRTGPPDRGRGSLTRFLAAEA